jgi:ferric-dicitrate binding protein FerR (iron transport regulator)
MKTPESIDTIIIRKLSGTATEEELHTLEDWLNSSEVNRQYAAQMQEIWEKSADAKIYQAIDIDKNWNEFEANSRWGQGKSRPLFYSWWQAAAVFLLVAGGAWLGYSYWLGQQMVMIAAIDQPVTHPLPDGSVVYLQPDSWIQYHKDLGASGRVVSFGGNAFFQVEKESAGMSFHVHTFNSKVVVLGTSFTLNANEEKNTTSLSLYEGKVLFSLARDSVVLEPGEKVLLKGSELTKENFREEQPLLDFNNTPVSEIFRALSGKYLIEFFYEKELPYCTITGNLNAKTLDETLTYLEFIMGMKYRVNGHLVLIEEINCEQ